MRRRGATGPVADVLHDSRLVQQATLPDFIGLFGCVNRLQNNAIVAGSKLSCPIRRDDAGLNAKQEGLGQVPRQWLNWTATSPTGKLTP